MKRAFVFILIILLFFLEGCKREEDYYVEKHYRDSTISRQFDMISCQRGNITYHVETDKIEVAKKVVGIINNFCEEYNIDKLNIEIYVLNRVIVENEKENVFIFEIDKIVDDKWEIEKQKLLYETICDEYWIAYGISHETLNINDNIIKEFFEKNDDKKLDMHALRFFQQFSDEEDVKCQKIIAISILQNCDKKEVKSLINGDEDIKKEVLSKWVKKMGLSEEIIEDNSSKETNIKIWEKEDELKIKIFDCKILVEGNPYDDMITNINDLENGLLYLCEDIRKITEYMSLKEEIIKKYNKTFDNKNILKVENGGNQYLTNSKIVVMEWDAIPHEIIHAYLCADGKPQNVVIGEGIAYYLGNVKNNTLLSNYNEKLVTSENQGIFDEEIQYYKNNSNFNSIKFNNEEYYHQRAVFYQNVKRNHQVAKLSDIKNKKIPDEYKDLTYIECADMVSYIINSYSFEKALELLNEKDLNLDFYYEEWKYTNQNEYILNGE